MREAVQENDGEREQVSGALDHHSADSELERVAMQQQNNRRFHVALDLRPLTWALALHLLWRYDFGPLCWWFGSEIISVWRQGAV